MCNVARKYFAFQFLPCEKAPGRAPPYPRLACSLTASRARVRHKRRGSDVFGAIGSAPSAMALAAIPIRGVRGISITSCRVVARSGSSIPTRLPCDASCPQRRRRQRGDDLGRGGLIRPRELEACDLRRPFRFPPLTSQRDASRSESSPGRTVCAGRCGSSRSRTRRMSDSSLGPGGETRIGAYPRCSRISSADRRRIAPLQLA